MNWKRLLFGTWSWKRPFIFLGSIYVIPCLFAISCAARMIFLPPHPTYTAEIDGYTKINSKSEHPVAAIHLKAQPNT